MRRGDALLSQAIEQKDETALRRILNCDEVGDGTIPMLYIPSFYEGSTRNIEVSPLGYAAHCGWTAGVQILSTSGWRVDSMSSRFLEYKDLMPEALTLATERNDVETVAVLVELGAPPNKKLIYAACRLNLAQVLKVLDDSYDRSEQLTLKCHHMTWLLRVAVEAKAIDSLVFLLEKYANMPNCGEDVGLQAIQLAREQQRDEVVLFLQPRINLAKSNDPSDVVIRQEPAFLAEQPHHSKVTLRRVQLQRLRELPLPDDLTARAGFQQMIYVWEMWLLGAMLEQAEDVRKHSRFAKKKVKRLFEEWALNEELIGPVYAEGGSQFTKDVAKWGELMSEVA